jgi:hypothetical protein
MLWLMRVEGYTICKVKVKFEILNLGHPCQLSLFAILYTFLTGLNSNYTFDPKITLHSMCQCHFESCRRHININKQSESACPRATSETVSGQLRCRSQDPFPHMCPVINHLVKSLFIVIIGSRGNSARVVGLTLKPRQAINYRDWSNFQLLCDRNKWIFLKRF